MLFDVVLPSIISLITIAIVFIYSRFETKVKSLFEEKEFQIRDAIFLVIAMGAMVTIIAFIPEYAIQVLFLAAYSFILFLFAYVAVEKWYLAVLPPILFVSLYLSDFWGYWLVNIFAIVFAVLVSVYMGGLFSWTTVLVFAGLITVMDVIQVFGTEFMVTAAGKFTRLQLPVLIQVPTFPRQGGIILGLGDIFLTGLLAIQITLKYGKKAGVLSAFTSGLAFFLFEVAILNYDFAAVFPATLVVVFGWIAAFGIVYPDRVRTVGALGGVACFLAALVIGITMLEITLKSIRSTSLPLVTVEAVTSCISVIFGILAFIIPYAIRRLPRSGKQLDK